MQKLEMGVLIQSGIWLVTLKNLCIARRNGRADSPEQPEEKYTADNFQQRRRELDILHSALLEAELNISANYVKGLISHMDSTIQGENGDRIFRGANLEGAIYQLEQFSVVFPSEAKSKKYLAISPGTVPLYEGGSLLFGVEVEQAFSDALYDIEEAGKCLALDRTTAAVFHLMRAMETAVRIVGQKIQATVTDVRGETLAWGVIVSNMKNKIDALPRGSQDEWFKIHALLHSVNRAFRTKTAHPVHKYDSDEAKTAFNATKGFMQELAAMIA